MMCHKCPSKSSSRSRDGCRVGMCEYVCVGVCVSVSVCVCVFACVCSVLWKFSRENCNKVERISTKAPSHTLLSLLLKILS